MEIRRLRRALEHITRHTEEWEQGVWGERTACGTKCCLAGTAVLQGGYEVVWQQYQLFSLGAFMTVPSHINLNEGDDEGVESAAQEYLQLTDEEVGDLFYTVHSDPRRLWEIAERLSKGAIQATECDAIQATECDAIRAEMVAAVTS